MGLASEQRAVSRKIPVGVNGFAAHGVRYRLPGAQQNIFICTQPFGTYGPAGVKVRVQAIQNRFFGETITVTGLLTGRDILEQLDTDGADEVILCQVTLREAGDLFLDDLPLSEFRAALPVPLTITPNRGDALFAALLGSR